MVLINCQLRTCQWVQWSVCIFGRYDWRRMPIHDLCGFLSTININTRYNNHCMCRICLNQTLYTYCWLCSTCVGHFQHGKHVFWKSCILMKFEFLSTVVNQGTIIRIENLFIVNKIDKFNVSGFRNTQARFQRTSKSREPFDLMHVQIHVFLP